MHAAARSQSSKQLVLQQITSKATLQDYIDYKKRPEAFNVHMLSPDLELHVARYLQRPVPWGFFATLLAMQKCRKVTVYGLTANHRGHVQVRRFLQQQPRS
jgi:hypothetical protein